MHDVGDLLAQRFPVQLLGLADQGRPVDLLGVSGRQDAPQPRAGVPGVLEHVVEEIIVRLVHGDSATR